jgi:hypothetical protein
MSTQLILFGSAEQPGLSWRQKGTPEGEPLLYAVSEDPHSPEGHGRPAAANVESSQQQVRILIRTYRPDHKGVRLEVIVGESRSVSLPARALLVDLAGNSAWVDLMPGSVYIQPLQALVVPATKELEKHLDQFHTSLMSLPPDHRAAILYTLVAPDLEIRMASLEAFRAQMEERRSRPVTLVDAGGDWLRRRDAWLIASVVLVVLVVSLLLAYSALSHSLSNLRKNQAASQQRTSSETQRNAPVMADPANKVSSPVQNKPVRNTTRSRSSNNGDSGPKDQKKEKPPE